MPEMMRPETAGKVPVIECFTLAWRFMNDNWRILLPAAAITAVLSQAGVALVFAVRPADATQSMLASTIWDVIAMLPAMVASMLFTAVVLRKAIRNEFIGRTGLVFGADEVRLLAVALALMCLLLPLGGLFFFVMTGVVLSRLASSPEQLDILLNDPEAMSEALEASLGPTGVLAFVLFAILVMALAVYISVKLAMVNAATIGERRVVIFQTWSWSRGNLWRVLGALILTALPVFFLGNILESLRLSVLAAAPGMVTLMATNALIAFVLALGSIPSIALGAILYKGLRPADFVAK
jgi:hypothetical protein